MTSIHRARAPGAPGAAGVPGPQTALATEAQRQQAQRAGWTAKEIGMGASHCPYLEGDARRDVWLAAHAAATTITSDELIDGANAPVLDEGIDAVIARVRASRAAYRKGPEGQVPQ